MNHGVRRAVRLLRSPAGSSFCFHHHRDRATEMLLVETERFFAVSAEIEMGVEPHLRLSPFRVGSLRLRLYTILDVRLGENSSVMVRQAGGETSLIGAATAGDDDAFRRLVEPIRGELHLHCYRMLGSSTTPKTCCRTLSSRPGAAFGTFDGRASFRTWMFRVATNTCLDALRTRPPPRASPGPERTPGIRRSGSATSGTTFPGSSPTPMRICRRWTPRRRQSCGRACDWHSSGHYRFFHPGNERR